jgi:uncharacterized surface protein with fasciclin (FAS1) repeats
VPIIETLDCTNGSEFLGALNDADLADTYNDMGNVTFFTPQDGSFEANSTMDCASIQRHVVENEALYTPDLKDGDVIESASGENLYVNILDDEFYINCVRVITTDNIVSNGVIHVVEKVYTYPPLLLPYYNASLTLYGFRPLNLCLLPHLAGQKTRL